jgi:hypothetical protein
MKLTSNEISHEIVNESNGIDDVKDLQASWEQNCSVNIAKQWRKSVDEMSDTLCTVTACSNPIHISYLSSWGT